MQYRLRTLLITVSLACVAFAWLGRNGISPRHHAIMRLQRPGIELSFEHQGARTTFRPFAKAPGGRIWKRIFGEYYQARVIQIEVVPPAAFTDEDCRRISTFLELDWLAANDTAITDNGLKELASLRSLGRLDIERCPVTANGVTRLRRSLPNTAIYSDHD